MAEINPRLKVPNDPSYIGYSRETQGDTSLAGLVAGLGNVGVQGLVAADGIIQDQLTAEIKEGIETGPDANQSEDQLVTPTPTDGETEAVDVFGEDRLQANPDIQGSSRQGQRLTEAYRQGKISSTYYWGQMTNLSKQLKARYPGYSNVIDRQFQGLTGNLPANALAKAKRDEYTGYLSKVNEEEKYFQRFVSTNIEYLPPDYFERARAGDPYTKLETYERVHRLQSRDLANKATKDKLALANAEGSLVQENAVGAASNEANTIVNAAMADTVTQGVLNEIQTKLRSAGLGQLPTPQEKQQLRAAVGLLRSRVESRVEAAMRAPSGDGGHTYYSMIKDPNKVQTVVKTAMAPFDQMQKLLDDDEYGLFAMTMNYSKAQEADTKSQLLQEPMWAAVAAAKDLGGSDFVSQAAMDPKYAKEMGPAVKAFVDLATTKRAAGQTTPLIENVQTVVKSTPENPQSGKAGARALVENAVAGLISDKATPSTRLTSATDIFGPGNGQFLRHFAPSTQIQLFDQLVSPNVTQAMLKVKDQDPALWDDYREWAKNSFISLQRANAATIQEGFSQREELDLTWDKDAHQFRYKKTPLGAERERQRAAGDETMISGVEGAFTQDVELAVKHVNRQIHLIAQILKAEGADVTKELDLLLKAMNINPLSEKQKTVFQKFRNLLDAAVSEDDKGKATGSGTD